jgi:hypothetical protein
LELGCPHPDFLRRRLTVEQLNDWADYFRREPFGFPAADLFSSHLAHVVAASIGNADLNPGDFMLGPALREPTLTEGLTDDQKQMRAIEQLFAGSGVLLGPDGKPIS